MTGVMCAYAGGENAHLMHAACMNAGCDCECHDTPSSSQEGSHAS